MRSVRPLATLAVAVALLLFGAPSALAQSSLFSIPTTDVVDARHVYLEFDLVSHLGPHSDGGFQSYTLKSIVGSRGGVEAGVNVSGENAFEPDQPVELQPNVKWRFLDDEKTGVAAALGGVLYAPVANREDDRAVGFVYSCVSESVRPMRARFTEGAYGLVGRRAADGARGGGLFGYEQTLTRRVSFVADWVTGANRFGYVTPGFAATLWKRGSLTVGYNVGNEGRKNNTLYLTYGYAF